jgi:hypothetical protein
LLAGWEAISRWGEAKSGVLIPTYAKYPARAAARKG